MVLCMCHVMPIYGLLRITHITTSAGPTEKGPNKKAGLRKTVGPCKEQPDTGKGRRAARNQPDISVTSCDSLQTFRYLGSNFDISPSGIVAQVRYHDQIWSSRDTFLSPLSNTL